MVNLEATADRSDHAGQVGHAVQVSQVGHGPHANSRDDLPIPDLLAVINPRQPLPRAKRATTCCFRLSRKRVARGYRRREHTRLRDAGFAEMQTCRFLLPLQWHCHPCKAPAYCLKKRLTVTCPPLTAPLPERDSVSVTTKGGHSMPRGKKELAE